jgi:hypothetical protein
MAGSRVKLSGPSSADPWAAGLLGHTGEILAVVVVECVPVGMQERWFEERSVRHYLVLVPPK